MTTSDALEILGLQSQTRCSGLIDRLPRDACRWAVLNKLMFASADALAQGIAKDFRTYIDYIEEHRKVTFWTCYRNACLLIDALPGCEVRCRHKAPSDSALSSS